MTEIEPRIIIDNFMAFVNDKAFPCIGARASLAKRQLKCMVADHMACAKDDFAILQFLYDFVDEFRQSDEIFYSAAILFRGPEIYSEEMFDELLWKRLQAFSDLDAENYDYDNRVDADPSSPNFSYSLKEEAFFIIGMHPASSRPPRRFSFPVLAFNPHAQFERLRETLSYQNMKSIIHRREIAYSDSVNPMLKDFGEFSEIYQYSGRNYDNNWQCPLKINHGKIKHNSTS